MTDIKTVSIIGLGAIGSFFAPRLFHKLGDKNFRVIADGERKERLSAKGVNINDTIYKFPIVSPNDKMSPADLVLIAVKHTSLDEALKQVSNQIGDDTIIISLLNGIDSEDKVSNMYSGEHVVPAFMRVSASNTSKGFYHNPDEGVMIFGEKDGNNTTERINAIKSLLNESNINYILSENILREIWFKFMSNIGENMVGAMLGLNYGAFQISDHANYLRCIAMRETVSIANSLGIDLSEDDIKKQEEISKGFPFGGKNSTLQDLENNKKTEVDMFSGEIIRLGKKLNIATPINEVLFNSIKSLEEKNEGKFN